MIFKNLLQILLEIFRKYRSLGDMICSEYIL